MEEGRGTSPKSNLFSGGVAGLFLLAGTAVAQNAAPIPVQVDSIRDTDTRIGTGTGISGLTRRSPRDSAGFAPTTDNEADVGEQLILVAKDNWEPFRFGIDTGVSYTSNVALLENFEEEDTFFISGVYGSWTPKIKGNLFGEVSVRQHFYRYDEFDELFDTDIFDVDAGLIYIIPKLGDLAVFARYGYLRLNDGGDFGDELFANQSITIGAQKIFRISRGHKAFLGYTSEFSLDATVDASKRDEHVLFLGYEVKWTERLRTNLIYRGAYYNYDEFGRDDINQQLGIGLSFELTDWAKLSTNLSFTSNDSDIAGLDYEVWNVTGGLALEIQF